jgi:hypothetical protein
VTYFLLNWFLFLRADLQFLHVLIKIVKEQIICYYCICFFWAVNQK